MVTEFLLELLFGFFGVIVGWLPDMPAQPPFSFAVFLQFNYIMPITEIVTCMGLYVLAIAGLTLFRIVLAVIP